MVKAVETDLNELFSDEADDIFSDSIDIVKKAVGDKTLTWGVVGDLHLSLFEKLGTYDRAIGLNSRLVQKLNSLEKAVDLFLKKKVDAVFFLGDIYDDPNPPDKLRKIFFEVVHLLIDKNVRVYIIVGNHDTDGKVSAFDDLSFSSSHFDVVRKTETTIIKDKKFLLVPWGNVIPSDLKDKNDIWLFGHFSVAGADYGTGRKVVGVEYGPKDLNSFAGVTLGHIHLRQKYYIGSLSRNNFGERKYECGVEIGIWNDDGPISRWFEIDDVPFLQFRIDGDINGILEEIKSSSDVNAFCKIIFEGKRSWLKSIDYGSLRKDISDNFSRIIFERRVKKEEDDPIESAITRDGQFENFFEIVKRFDTSDRKKVYKYIMSLSEGK